MQVYRNTQFVFNCKYKRHSADLWLQDIKTTRWGKRYEKFSGHNINKTKKVFSYTDTGV